MGESSAQEVAPEPSVCREELNRVLASRTFRNAPALSKILSYICHRHLDDMDANITEWSIALDALARKGDFDPAKDSIVRVEFHLLRKRLAEFYANEGQGNSVRISLAKIGYVPRFVAVQAEEEVKIESVRSVEHSSIPASSPVIRLPIGEPAVPDNLRVYWKAKTVTAAILVLSAAVVAIFFRSTGSTSVRDKAMSYGSPAMVSNEGGEVRILAGMSAPRYIDTSGRSWASDAYVTGGTVFSRPDRQIAGTLDQQMYKQGRQGDFRYDIPLKQGSYELRMFFAETEYGQTPLDGAEAQRMFAVSVNGKALLQDFDISDDAGGPNIAVPKVFTGIHPADDGFLHIAFSSHVGRPILNAFEIVPNDRGKPLPIRIVCSTHSAFDRDGHLWLSDTHFGGGRQSDRSANFIGNDDVALYSSARFGHFTYSIPVVANYQYRVTLRFVDASFKDPGKRIFNVSCNGMPLLTNFDVVKAAGGQNRMYKISFRHLKPSPQDKLILNFEPVRDYAILRAIEVEPD